MGHIPVHLLEHINSLENKVLSYLDCICRICPKAKQAKNTIHSSFTKSTQAYDLIHVDECVMLRELVTSQQQKIDELSVEL